MKKIFSNILYFIKEAKTMIKLNLLSNILTLFSIGIIFFFSAMIVSGWWVSNQVVEVIQGEAEINVYFDESIDSDGAAQLVKRVKDIEGVEMARIVDETEAYNRMVKILGKEAHVLEVFEDNPFSSFIEVKINLEEIDHVLEGVNQTMGVEYVRDNREILNRIRNIADVLTLLGYMVVAAVGIATLVIISHIIRMGIYNNRDQINTLRLLGAPESFIAFPFLLEGLFLTLSGGIIASALTVISLKFFYIQMEGPLPIIPLPPIEALMLNMVAVVIFLSSGLGIIGSLLGISSAKGN